MRLSELVEELKIATQANGRSERTVADYEQKSKPLVKFLGDPEIDTVTVRDLRRYVAHLRSRSARYQGHPNRDPIERGLAPTSVAGYVRVLRRLFNFALEEGLIDENPAKSIRVPKPERGEPKAIATQDFLRLLAAIDDSRVVGLRDRALLLLLADSAARVGGVVRLRLSDLDLEQQIAYLREKGGKGRCAFFSPLTRDALQAWLNVRPVDRGDRLFVNLGSRGNCSMTPQSVREVLRRLKRKAGVAGPVNPHSFRHAFAREYLSNGGDLASLADIMGHSDVRVTWMNYAIYRTEELKAKHAQLSPVARIDLTRPGSSGASR